MIEFIIGAWSLFLIIFIVAGLLALIFQLITIKIMQSSDDFPWTVIPAFLCVFASGISSLFLLASIIFNGIEHFS